MKKVTSLLLALVMALALAVPAFAETVTPTSGDTSSDVQVTVKQPGDTINNGYYLKVDWEVPSFSYTYYGSTYTWNTDGMYYTSTKNGTDGWAAESKNITLKVTNQSDVTTVNCEANLTKDANQPGGLTVTYTKSKANQTTAAAVVASGKAPSDYTETTPGTAGVCDLSGTIAVSGAPSKTATKLATITLTLEKA